MRRLESLENTSNWLISILDDYGVVNLGYSIVTMLPSDEELNWAGLFESRLTLNQD